MKIATVAVAAVLCLALTPGAAQADDPEGDVPADVSASFTQSAIADALQDGSDNSLSEAEEQAVEDYVDDEGDEGVVVEPQDVVVGTLTSGDLEMVMVAPDSESHMQSLAVATDDQGEEIGVAALGNDVADGTTPTQNGPGMGSWPSWDSSFHATVKLNVSVNGFDIGSARFQTYRRKFNDDSSTIDSWQLARNGVATPVTNYSPAPRVAKLWVSQDLTDSAFAHAREWLTGRTAPESGFSECNDSGVTLTFGPFSYSPSDCSDYDVWTGRIAHHRVAMDQGASAGTGARELAYTTGWTMDDGAAVNMTWYEFVTFRVGQFSVDSPDFKCTQTARGDDGTTTTFECDFDHDWS